MGNIHWLSSVHFYFTVFVLPRDIAIHPVIHAFISLRHGFPVQLVKSSGVSVQQERKGIVSLKKSPPNKVTCYISVYNTN